MQIETMEIKAIENENGRVMGYVVNGSHFSQYVDRINDRLAAYERLLKERNDLDVLCQNYAIANQQLHAKIKEMKDGIM